MAHIEIHENDGKITRVKLRGGTLNAIGPIEESRSPIRALQLLLAGALGEADDLHEVRPASFDEIQYVEALLMGAFKVAVIALRKPIACETRATISPPSE